jgi:glycosyltransferase involved in cell wall biosynthesis
MHPAEFLFSSTRLDWDEKLAAATPGVERVTLPRLLHRVWTQDYEVIEIPEPLAIPLLPHAVLMALAVKGRRVLRRARPTTLVFYAIENLDQVDKLRSRVPAPSALLRLALRLAARLVFSETSRAAFGTDGALEVYRALFGARRWQHLASHTAVKVIPGLSAAIGAASPEKNDDLLCFLGSFEKRKGIDKVLAAWPTVERLRPGSSLVVIGHGELAPEVRTFAREHDEVTLFEDPPRDLIRDTLASSHVLVLPSQRTPVWREQIGLPILEALSYGCEIVTTSETGIAEWLRRHGHRVIDPAANVEALAGAMISALDDDRDAEDIRAKLPVLDGRIVADTWLFES